MCMCFDADIRTLIADNGTLAFWDYDTGTPFQNLDDIPQPGSLDAEAGVFCSTFDMTGTRLITGGADKTIKVCCHMSSNILGKLTIPSLQIYSEQA
jgi:WD40 repeat protein